jgi:Dock homology region 2
VQESFNTICCSINVVTEESGLSFHLIEDDERAKVVSTVFDLLLNVLTFPQSSVTQLRGMGVALYALETFGPDLFLEQSAAGFQNWARLILTLMNSTSLSVRSITVDFVICLLSGLFNLHGSIDSVLIVFASIVPEVAAREILLYHINGLVLKFEDMYKSLWPIRRSIADIDDADPLDDDRVDRQLSPVLAFFCRSCQAIIDGVLVEIRLQLYPFPIAGLQPRYFEEPKSTFDSDEESLYEASNFFKPETAPMQRLRWLLTLKALHEEKKQWMEAAEVLFLCATTILDAMPYVGQIWRPSSFSQWSTSRYCSLHFGQGSADSAKVLKYVNHFLEPTRLLGVKINSSKDSTVEFSICKALCSVFEAAVNECFKFYDYEDNVDDIAYTRSQIMLKELTAVSDCHIARRHNFICDCAINETCWIKQHGYLRRMSAVLSTHVATLAHRTLVYENTNPTGYSIKSSSSMEDFSSSLNYCILRISGPKPLQFSESTTMPTFIEWDKPVICRIPRVVFERDKNAGLLKSKEACESFAGPVLHALKQELGDINVVLQTDCSLSNPKNQTVVSTFPVIATSFNLMSSSSYRCLQSKHFIHQSNGTLVEDSVAIPFPCALSRQSLVLRSIQAATRF